MIHIEIPKGAKKIIQILNEHGYEAYIVGGCVRDALLNQTPSDWDICTSATPKQMLEVLSTFHLVPTGLQHGTITVVEKDGNYEVTTFRIDGEYQDHRRPATVAYTQNLVEDLSRRDFTINAMAWHPSKGLIDLYGGVDDLNNRLIRAVGDSEKRFNEDGLRMLRMVRFATVLDFDFDQATYEATLKYNYLLKHISKERIQIEFNKMLLADHPARGLQVLYDLGMYSYIFPKICHMVGFSQHGGHHFLDVFEHSILACGVIEKNLVLRLTMLLHDIGKPFVWEYKKEHAYDDFPAHEAVSAKIADEFFRTLKYDNATRKNVVELISHHNDIITTDPISVRKCLSELGELGTIQLLKVKVADLIAHDLGHKRDEMISIFKNIENAVQKSIQHQECVSINQLAINGQDIMSLGYKGKNIGILLKACLTQVILEPNLNQKEKLLHFITQYTTYNKII